MKISSLLEGGDLEKALAKDIKAKFAKMKSNAPKSQSKRPEPKDPHPDKSMIWKKGFADGKAGRMDPKASDAYGPKTSEYEAGYAAGRKMKDDVSEMTSGSVASSMGNGNGFVNGGPGTLSRAGTTTTNKKGRKKMRKSVKEGLADLAQRAEHDHEVQMARADLYKIAKYAIKLHDMLKNVSEAEGIEGWQQSKITKAADYMGSVYHSLDYDMNVDNVAEGKSPHKKGTKKYKKHMAAMHAESTEYKESLRARLEEKAVSKSQQQAAGAALAVKKGEAPKSSLVGASKEMHDNMTKKELEDFAKTKHKGLPDKK